MDFNADRICKCRQHRYYPVFFSDLDWSFTYNKIIRYSTEPWETTFETSCWLHLPQTILLISGQRSYTPLKVWNKWDKMRTLPRNGIMTNFPNLVYISCFPRIICGVACQLLFSDPSYVSPCPRFLKWIY